MSRHVAIRLLTLSILLTGALSLASPASAQLGWAADSDTLFRVDLSTAETVELGQPGPEIGAMALSPEGELFAVDQGGATLYRLDPRAVTATAIGTTGTSAGVEGLAFDDTGALFMLTRTALYEVDPGTAAATEVGPLAVDTLLALAFTGGRLLALSLEWTGSTYEFVLYEIDRQNAATTQLFILPDLDNSTITPGVGMTAGEEGELWISISHIPPSLPPSSTLAVYRVSAASGEQLSFGFASGAPFLTTLAGVLTPTIDVPTLSPAGAALLVFGLLALAVLQLRRR